MDRHRETPKSLYWFAWQLDDVPVDSSPQVARREGVVLDLLLIFLKGSLREPFKKINSRFETLPTGELLRLGLSSIGDMLPPPNQR
jgi:hypothetical protein